MVKNMDFKVISVGTAQRIKANLCLKMVHWLLCEERIIRTNNGSFFFEPGKVHGGLGLVGNTEDVQNGTI